ncbi:GNAT family N-acetyltransferase [Ferrovibrio sp.]|jgi:predicted GNAT family acetyltransferase|uniref:GNAT family N-acetyltransferase n=1 Tax=Ferrovibrio sp. TaxID=1917215 RepID=UPI0035B3338B
MTEPANVTDNPERSRFELDVNGQTVFANYRRQGETVIITHVEAPVTLRGTGASGRLMQGIVEILQQRNEKVVPLCSYAAAWLKRKPEYAGIIG